MKRFFTLYAPEGDVPSGGGGAGPAWHESIITKGADGSESLADFNTWKDKAPAPLVKMITDNMTAARSKTEGMVKVPGEGATPEELSAFYKALGVPDTDDYGLKAPEGLPDGVTWDDNMSKAFQAEARKLGLTKAQVEGLAKFQVGQTSATIAQQRDMAAKVLEAEKADLTKRFGADIDKAVAAAKSLENAKGVPESLRAAAKGGAFDPQSPNFWGADALEAFAWAAKATGEDRGGGGPGVGAGAVDLAAAKDIMTNKDNPLHAKYWAGDKDTVERVNAAYKTAA